MTAAGGRSVVGPVEVARRGFEAVAAVALVGEAERVGEKALLDVLVDAVGARSLDASDGVLGGDLRVAGNERRGGLLRRDELAEQAVVVVEREAGRGAIGRVAPRLQALLPEVERLRAGDPQLDRV